MEKRGQATILIILGIVVAVLAILIMQSRTVVLKEETAVLVPEQVKGVVSYTDDCLRDLAEEGLNLIGLHGGYIDIPDYLKYNSMQSLQFDEFTYIPYWIYENGENIPNKEFMEEQLKNYVETNFEENCDFDDFLNEGYEFFYNDLNFDVQINDENVNVKLNSDLNANFREMAFDISDYIDVYFDNKIGKMHDMAIKIIEKELEDGALEFNTINLISIYSRENPDIIPPISGIDFKCGEPIWIKSNVKNHLKQILVENIPKLKILRTKYVPYTDIFYDSMTWSVFNKNYEDIAVNFNYFDDWDLDLDVFPSEGYIIKGDSLNTINPFLFLCTNIYHFVYDADYPIMINLVSEDGYLFRFPIKVVVKDNYARRRFLGNYNVKDINTPSLFCDLNQRLSKDIYITSYDENGDRLKEVDVIYLCAEEACSIGKSDNKGELTTKFPFCVNGEVNFVKDGYLVTRQKLDITPETSGILLSANMESFREIEVSAKILNVDKNLEVLGNSRDIKNYERVVANFNRFNYEINNYDYQASFVLNGNEKDIIKLIPGRYDVQITLMSDEDVLIPEKKYRQKIEGIPIGKEIIIPSTTLDSVILGSVEYSFDILHNDLINNGMEVYALSRGIPENYDDLEKILNIQYNSDQYGFNLIPIFK